MKISSNLAKYWQIIIAFPVRDSGRGGDGEEADVSPRSGRAHGRQAEGDQAAWEELPGDGGTGKVISVERSVNLIVWVGQTANYPVWCHSPCQAAHHSQKQQFLLLLSLQIVHKLPQNVHKLVKIVRHFLKNVHELFQNVLDML